MNLDRRLPGRSTTSTNCARPTMRRIQWRAYIPVAAVLLLFLTCRVAQAGQLTAGVAKVDITNYDAGPVNDPLFAKALVIRDGPTTAVIITVDAVAIGEIGHIKNDYLPKVRERLHRELGIDPRQVLINASHCHGVVCADIEQRTVQAVREAWGRVVPVSVGAGVGLEDRIMENRRLRLKNGREADVRHAYSLPPDEEVAGIGPVDSEIGILRLDKKNGETLAVVFNFACHPIQGVPGGANTADLSGFACTAIEASLDDGAVALFLQGCGGDINPVSYKAVDNPRDAEPLGNMLGLSTLRAMKTIQTKESAILKVIHENLTLPRAQLAPHIESLQAEQKRLLQSLRGTSLNLKTFLPLAVKYRVSGEYPSYYSHGYLRQEQFGRSDLKHLDADNARHMMQYIQNIYTMEQLTKLQINLDLLRKHHTRNQASETGTIDVELLGLRVGDFVITTFPGELTVQIGLNIKGRSPHEHTFVAGCTNGYIYYAPTSDQLKNRGGAQEDSDCLLAPEWQAQYEKAALGILSRL